MVERRMTNYDMMIDAVVNQIYLLYNQTDSWNEQILERFWDNMWIPMGDE